MNPEYIHLCREANLPREWQDGDQFCGVYPGTWFVASPRHDPAATEGAIWLPREGDLLDLLEAEDYVLIDIRTHAPAGSTRVEVIGHTAAGEHKSWHKEVGPDRCTALLRLLLAVRGVTSVGPQEPTKEPLPESS